MSIFQFIFLDFWHFLGTLILVSVIFEGTEAVIKAVRKSKKTYRVQKPKSPVDADYEIVEEDK